MNLSSTCKKCGEHFSFSVDDGDGATALNTFNAWRDKHQHQVAERATEPVRKPGRPKKE